MFGIGVQELLIILAIVLVLFGAKNLPLLGSNLGRTISNFKKGISEQEVIDVTAETKDADKKSS